MRQQRLVHLKLYLRNLQLLFQVRQERNSSLMTAASRDRVRFGVGYCERQVLDPRIQMQVESNDCVRKTLELDGLINNTH